MERLTAIEKKLDAILSSTSVPRISLKLEELIPQDVSAHADNVEVGGVPKVNVDQPVDANSSVPDGPAKARRSEENSQLRYTCNSYARLPATCANAAVQKFRGQCCLYTD